MKTIVKKIWDEKYFFPNNSYSLIVIFLLLSVVQSCTTINPGEIGLRIKRGKLDPQNYTQGRYANGFGNKFIKFSTRVQEVSFNTSLPTKEGLDAKTDLTVLYHLKPEAIQNIFLTLGMNYEKEVIKNNFAAIARETCLNYRAMELLTQRDSLERSIFVNMNTDLSHYGFVIDQVLVRYIDVPAEIDQAIEKKVLSEQQIKQQEVEILTQKRTTDAAIEKERKEMEFSMEKQKREIETTIQQERMQADFAIEKEKKESERKIIEGQAAKKIQEYQNSTITPMLIKYKTIDIMQALANSPNTKLIITDGKTPLSLLREDSK